MFCEFQFDFLYIIVRFVTKVYVRNVSTSHVLTSFSSPPNMASFKIFANYGLLTNVEALLIKEILMDSFRMANAILISPGLSFNKS